MDLIVIYLQKEDNRAFFCIKQIYILHVANNGSVYLSLLPAQSLYINYSKRLTVERGSTNLLNEF